MRWQARFVFYFICFLTSFLAFAGPPSAPKTPQAITVVATTDFHGAMEARWNETSGQEVGGIAITAAYIKAMRQRRPDSMLLLDGGDLYQGTLLSAAGEGKSVVEFYNDLGYDAIAVGNHDFDFGPIGYRSVATQPEDDPLEVIRLRISEARFPFLAGNIFDRDSGKPVQWKNLLPYTLIKRQGVVVAVIGLTAVDTPLTTHPNNVRMLEFRPLLPNLRRLIPEVRARGATVVILLAHAGVRFDEKNGRWMGPLAELAEALTPGEVDLIVGGHMHCAFSGRIHDIPIIQGPPNGTGFVFAELPLDPATRKVRSSAVQLKDKRMLLRANPDGSPVLFEGQQLQPDPATVERLNLIRQDVSELQQIILGRATEALANRTLLDSPVGALVTDAMRSFDKQIDIAMYNSGGLRTSLPAGEITFGRVYEIVPFDNNMVILSLTGEQIQEIVEHGLGRAYGVMELSGLKVTFDRDAPLGRRCVSIETSAGEELKRDRTYRVATNDFVLNGGDGYYAFARGREVQNTHTLIRELVASYIKEKGIIHPPVGGRYVPYKRASADKVRP